MTEVFNDNDLDSIDLSNEFDDGNHDDDDNLENEFEDEDEDDLYNSFEDDEDLNLNASGSNGNDGNNFDDDGLFTNEFSEPEENNENDDDDDNQDDYDDGVDAFSNVVDLNEDYKEASKNNEENEEEPTEEEDKKISIKSIFDGSLITNELVVKNIPYILFVAAFLLINIGNRNHAEVVIRNNNALRNEVHELRAQSIIITAKLITISKEAEVAERIRENHLGIKPHKEPPMFFMVKKFVRADSLTSESAQRKFIKKINQSK